MMKTKKETVNIYELTPQEHVALINSRKHSKTWEAAMKSQGCLIVTDPNLM
jgi:putative SOS response-associated peptidase YedK